MIKKTSLYKQHVMLGAKMVDFSGWHMPLYYRSQLEEHMQVRENCGLFDVSHMGIVDMKGSDVKSFLRQLLANNIDKMKSSGKALYSCLLNPEGGILDDLIVYYLGENDYRLVVNAATAEKDLAWFKQKSKKQKVTITPRQDLSLLALQGRNARKILKKAFPNMPFVDGLKPFTLANYEDYTVASTGYTGEDGFEITVPAEKSMALWKQLLVAGAKPIGLGARDSLRLEAGLNLYGSDMDETVTPLESNLGWTVAFEPDDRDFIGRSALEKQKAQGVKRQLKSIRLLKKGVLRAGQPIFEQGKEIGHVTSGTYSPLLKQSIGFARVGANASAQCEVEIRGELFPVELSKPPIWRKNYQVHYHSSEVEGV